MCMYEVSTLMSFYFIYLSSRIRNVIIASRIRNVIHFYYIQGVVHGSRGRFASAHD